MVFDYLGHSSERETPVEDKWVEPNEAGPKISRWHAIAELSLGLQVLLQFPHLQCNLRQLSRSLFDFLVAPLAEGSEL
jgi:hypothetical protein